MRNDHPCKKDCPRRTGTCRAMCPDLAAYNAARAEAHAEREAERKRENMIADYVSDAIKAGKWRRKRR